MMAARTSWRPPLITNEEAQKFVDAQAAAWKSGRGSPIKMRDAEYSIIRRAMVAGRRLAEAEGKGAEWGRARALGGPETERRIHKDVNKKIMRALAQKGLTPADIGIVVGTKGHLSGPDGFLRPYFGGEDFPEEIVLLVEKKDTADPLAEALAPLGVKVGNIEGNSSGKFKTDTARWVQQGKRVFVLTDQDFGGHEIAKHLVAQGAARLRLAEFEALAGAPLDNEYIIEDLSYLRQTSPGERLGKMENDVLLALGARIGFRGPGGCSLNAQREAWGGRYPALIRAAIEARIGWPLSGVAAPPARADEPDLF